MSHPPARAARLLAPLWCWPVVLGWVAGGATSWSPPWLPPRLASKTPRSTATTVATTSTATSTATPSSRLAATAADSVLLEESQQDEVLVPILKGELKSTTATLDVASSLASGSVTTTTTVSPSPSPTPGRPATSSTIVVADSHEFVKPDRDLREYRVIRLPNNLQCLLVSDNLQADEVGVEAASVHVQAGHFDDTLPGLSHFHEHMLFLGTRKYPGEDDYESFLSKYGGFSNAYTDMEDTNYYFSVTTTAPDSPHNTTDALKGGLDRLAQFFVAPLFDPDAVDRELNAIDSEYRNGKTSDAWRNYQLLKASCNQSHPFANFGCGNYRSLLGLEDTNSDDDDGAADASESDLTPNKERLLRELDVFWKTYYQTYNLRLAVVGHGSLDALQQTVEETFGALPASQGAPRRVKTSTQAPDAVFQREHAVYGGIPAFGPSQVGVLRQVIPVTEMRTLKVYFATPPLDDPALKRSKPYRTLSHLLGHESPGSLHDLLSEQPGGAWISSLSSGIGIDTSDFSLFSITLSLTPKGMQQHLHQILDLVFAWIGLVRKHAFDDNDPNRLAAYHEELRQITDMNFRFRENGDPTDFCSTASELLFDEATPHSNLLLGGSETSEYDPVIAKAFLDRLTPENCMITILNSDYTASNDTDEGWMTEPLYGAQYRAEPITPEQMKRWGDDSLSVDPRLKLPALNAYIPSDFSLRADDAPLDPLPDPNEPPKLLIDRPNLRLWHKLDRHWRVPKTFIKVAILSPKAYQTPRTMTLSRIFQRVLNDDLNSFVYDASIAGCSYRVSCTPFGYRISVRGYSEKLPFLLDTLTTRILSLIQDMKDGANNPTLLDKFEKAKESLLRETKNYRLDPPNEVANYNSRLLIEENVWYLDNYIDELEGPDAERHPMTIEECAHVAEDCFMGRVKCEAMCMGNIDEAGAQQVVSVIDRHFLGPTSRALSEVETPRFKSLKIPTHQEAVRIFGPSVEHRSIPLVYQDIALSASEENNAIEMILQAGCELDLGYEGMALLDLISHMAYTSAFNQLRTKEQLGYIVSAFARKTAGGTWGMSIVVQSSKALPSALEERCEAWLETFRQELQDMPAADMAEEASAVVAQLLEKETKLSQEVSRMWGEIINTEGLSDRMRTPSFDRLDRLAQELTVADSDDTNAASAAGDEASSQFKTPAQLKERVLSFFDRHFSVHSLDRRAMSARVYNQASQSHYDASIGQPGVLSSYADMRHYKQFLSSWPNAPYWRVVVDPSPSSSVSSSSSSSSTPTTSRHVVQSEVASR